ncbi:CHAT domain-containing protein [Paraphoma chrysanthemicola]|uniref:CHAT domain-containing protein n=1 Tax=Paraphoma chrysanthemicola TaxID=798071 RepID=A0A8K0W0R5_9PLEO|nr:CHAT domain-containing protein [Paraphoma chrysanthemicola]
MRPIKGSLVVLAEASRAMSEHELDESIRNTRDSIKTIPKEDHTNRIEMLHSLAIQLSARYYKYESDFAVDEAIQVMREVIRATPKDHPELLDRLYLLENRVSDKWSITKDLKFVDESISLIRDMVEITRTDDEQLEWLAYLAIGLWQRYSQRGLLSDLDESIGLSWKVFEGSSRDRPTVDQIGWCTGLTSSLLERYHRLGTTSDIEEAINVTRILLRADFGEGAWLKPGIVDNLAIMLQNKYARERKLADLEESIHQSQRAIEMTPTKESSKGAFLSTLAQGLTDRYRLIGDLADLEEGIKLGYEAIEMTSVHSSSLPELLGSLAERLREKYEVTGGSLEDLDDIIGIASEAVNGCPTRSPVLAIWLHVLSSSLATRYLKVKEESDLQRATDVCMLALNHSASMTSARVRAGIAAMVYHEWADNWTQAYETAILVIPLLSGLMPQSLQQSDKRYILGQSLGAYGFASLAVAAALSAGKEPLDALKILEQGRGLFAMSLEELRTDVLDLREYDPQLADRFVALRNQLDLPSEMVSRDTVDLSNVENRGDRRYEAGHEFDELVVQIRELPGFEGFLLASGEQEIRAAAQHGTVIVINISAHRCDALVVKESGVGCIPLPGLKIDDIKEKAKCGDLGSVKTLNWLWDVVGNPVLTTLGFTASPTDNHWPHIWWIPTGPLSKFPLHAAGYHAPGSEETVLDRVMSSYSSSIKAMIQGRKTPATEDKKDVPKRALLVAMQDTPKHRRLRFAAEEIEVLKPLCHSIAHEPCLTENLKADIMLQLPSCAIFHFAGHGYTDDVDPSQSSLLLKDWNKDPFTVSTLLELNLRSNPLFLAYLSACGTGEVRDERFFDESFHLISAFQIAGFRHVIGTLWEVDDSVCVDIAKTTYEALRDEGMTDLAVCRGLHRASLELRDRWLLTTKEIDSRNEFAQDSRVFPSLRRMQAADQRNADRLGHDVSRKVVLDDSDDSDDSDEEDWRPPHWVPYVHFGV